MVCDEANGFIRVGHDCLSCEGGSDITGAAMSLLGVCIFMLLCVFVYVLFVKPPKTLQGDERTSKDYFVGVVVILVSYMQIISVMARTVSGSVKLPNEWIMFSNGMFFVNFDLAFAMPFVSCRLSIPFVAKLLLHMVTPIAFFITIQLATSLATCVRRHKSKLLVQAQKNAGLTILQNLGILLYPSLTTRIFSGFRCYNVEGVGYRLESDFSIPCWEDGGSHEFIRALAIAGTIVYTIGFPLWIFFDLWRHRKSLHDPSHDDYTLTRLRLGAQYEQYETYYWFWSPIIIVYKMLMVGALSVVEQHSPVQLFVGCLVTNAYLLLVLRAAPYIDDSLDRLSFLTSLSLSLTLLLCLMKGTDEHRAERESVNYDENPWDMFDDAVLSRLMMVVNMLPFAYAAASLLMQWRRQISLSVSKFRRRKFAVSPEQGEELEFAAGPGFVNFPTRQENGEKVAAVRSWEDD
jgi:hypothetical protein